MTSAGYAHLKQLNQQRWLAAALVSRGAVDFIFRSRGAGG